MRIISFFSTYLVSTAKKYFSLFTDMNLLIWKAKEVQILTDVEWPSAKGNKYSWIIIIIKEGCACPRGCASLWIGTQYTYFELPANQSCQSSKKTFVSFVCHRQATCLFNLLFLNSCERKFINCYIVKWTRKWSAWLKTCPLEKDTPLKFQ